MDQPLWQIWLNVALIAFVARRAAVGLGLHWDEIGSALRAGYVGVLAVCALAAIAVWARARWVIAGLCAVALAFSVSTLLELSLTDLPPTWLVTQWLAALLGTLLLVRLARRARG